MKRGHTPFHADRRGCHLTLDAVPAWVCGQCGEAYFKESLHDSDYLRLLPDHAALFHRLLTSLNTGTLLAPARFPFFS